jgi:hypothetical protein
MNRFQRILIALACCLAGASLLPYIALPSAKTGPELFSDAYQPTETPTPESAVSVNFSTGQPGSFFTVTVGQFPGNSTATVSVNGHVLGTLPIDASGNGVFALNTTGADLGIYVVTVTVNPSASARFTLRADAPLRPAEGSALTLPVPAGIALNRSVYLPDAVR